MDIDWLYLAFRVSLGKMFKVEMREKYEHDMEIDSFDGKAIKSLIDYIYNGSIDISNENVVKLLQGADYLQLQEVKEFCCEFLVSIIASDNCIELLKKGNLYLDDDKFTQLVYRLGMCRIPDIHPVFGAIRRFLRYPVSGRIVLRYPAGYRIFLKFRKIAWSRLGKNKIYLLDLCEKTWCRFENFNLFGLFTKSRTESKP